MAIVLWRASLNEQKERSAGAVLRIGALHHLSLIHILRNSCWRNIMRKKDSTLSNEVLENLNSKFSENHPYRRSFSGFTFQFQFSVALGDDMFYDSKAQSRAAGGFGAALVHLSLIHISNCFCRRHTCVNELLLSPPYLCQRIASQQAAHAIL